MYANNQYTTRQPPFYPDQTQRQFQSRPQQQRPPISTQPPKIPGSKSLHLYNTLLLVFSLIQVCLYAIQGTASQCSQLGSIFYGFMGVYLYCLLVPIILWLCIAWQKGYTFALLYTIVGILGKIAVIIAVFLATQNHVGLCYVASDVKISVAVVNVAEALCLAVELLFIRQARKIQQLSEVQMFMDAGKRKGYF